MRLLRPKRGNGRAQWCGTVCPIGSSSPCCRLNASQCPNQMKRDDIEETCLLRWQCSHFIAASSSFHFCRKHDLIDPKCHCNFRFCYCWWSCIVESFWISCKILNLMNDYAILWFPGRSWACPKGKWGLGRENLLETLLGQSGGEIRQQSWSNRVGFRRRWRKPLEENFTGKTVPLFLLHLLHFPFFLLRNA